MFHVGQKVVCINNKADAGFVWVKGTRPTLNAIYTVRAVGITTYNNVGLRLNEIILSGYHCCYSHKRFEDAFYRADRFKPVIEKKTDISIFTQLLTPSKIKEPV